MTFQHAENSKIDISTLKEINAPKWDAYVNNHKSGSFFHLAGWRRVIERTLRQPAHYLQAEQHGQIVGILPLVEVRSPIFGNALVSTGFTVGGGLLCDNQRIESRLLRAAERLMHGYALDRIELRGGINARAGWLAKSDLYASFVRPMEPTIEANLARLRKRQRATVRRGLKFDFAISIEQDAEKFLPLYAESLHRHGTPMLPWNYYRALLEEFGDACDVIIVSDGGAPLGAMINFYYQGTVMPYYSGTLARARDFSIYDLMCFELMRHALETKGCTVFDMGRSKAGTGSYDFKRHWGFEPEPLTYHFCLRPGDTIPEINPLNPNYQRKIALWRKTPAPIINRLGPWLARQLG